MPFKPCVEIGWRLNKDYWGKGYATEAASEALRFGFEELSLEEIYSFTSVNNLRSRAVMARLGLINTGNNFLHPAIPKSHHLSEHVLYRIAGNDYFG